MHPVKRPFSLLSDCGPYESNTKQMYRACNGVLACCLPCRKPLFRYYLNWPRPSNRWRLHCLHKHCGGSLYKSWAMLNLLISTLIFPSHLRLDFSKWFFPSGFCAKYLSALFVVCAAVYCCHFRERSWSCKERLVAPPCFCLPVAIKFSTHWTDLYDILSIFRKSVEEIQVSLKYDNNNGYFTWTRMCVW